MSTISIQRAPISELETDAIVHSFDDGLWAESAAYTYPFREVGLHQLQFTSDGGQTGETGFAVITPGIRYPSRYMIHVVGPRWYGGGNKETQYLRSAYSAALRLAARNGCRSVGFPLLSLGIVKYPLEVAWRTALHACGDFFRECPDQDLNVVFAATDERTLTEGRRQLNNFVHGSVDLSGGARRGEYGRVVVRY